ncbi:MAG: hypothetical protein GXP26_11280 [Planctomycetes bacterium]|nr:hypothetical protein [Planctomycetota bacterium]
MHASLLFTAIALAGQLTGNNGGDRYGNLGTEGAPATTPPAALATTPPGQGNVVPPLPPLDENHGFADDAMPLNGALPAGAAESPQLKPLQLMRSFLEEPLRGKLVGTPWALADVVQGAPSRAEQTRRVEAYWELTATVAQYHIALQDVVRLKTLQASVRQPSPQWEMELQSLEAQVQVAGRTAKVAQHRLQRLLGRSADESLPLPSDMPHCGAYGTRYNEIFSERHSKLAGQLNELLPLNYQAIQSQAAGVVAANQWLQTVSQTRNPNTDGRGLLKAFELLALRRNAFVDAVRDYNVNIASYAEVASPGEVGTGRLMAMLMHLSPEQRQSWDSQGIRRASAEEPLGSRPKTFANERGERSILKSGSGTR